MVYAKASAEDFRHQLEALLPPGPAWPRDQDAIQGRLLEGIGAELALVHNDAVDLIGEFMPALTDDLLGDWEDVVGIPDECSPLAGTVNERRIDVLARLNTLGGSSAEYFESVAASLGFVATVVDHPQFRVGYSQVGIDPLIDDDYGVTWTINADVTGNSDAQISTLQCVLLKLKPQHTKIEFGFTPPVVIIEGSTPSIGGTPAPFVDSTQQNNPTFNVAHAANGPALILVGVKQGLANGPDPQTLVVTESGVALTQEGSTDPNQVRGNAPSWFLYYVQNPGGTGIQATISGTTNPTDALVIIPINVPGATGIGTISTFTETSAPATGGSLAITAQQDRSMAVAVFGVRGANTPSNQFTEGTGWAEVLEAATGVGDLDDFSFQVQSEPFDASGTATSTAAWTESGRWSGLLVEVLGTPGDSLPIANPDVAIAEAGGASIMINVLNNDEGGNLTMLPPSIISGGGVIDSFSQAGNITFTPPLADGVTVISYTAENNAGSASSTLTITSSSTPVNVLQFPSGATLEWPSGADVELP